MSKFKWRKWNNILHRDIGYLAVGLTVVFAISGIAVNHVDDWNPSYQVERKPVRIDPRPQLSVQENVAYILRSLNVQEQPQSTFRPAPQKLNIFLKNQTIEMDLQTGQGTWERIRERPVLRDLNYLHLNHAKKWWTWFSDIYALALLFLAISGLFVLKGKNGLAGRGKWLTAIGIIIPVLFIVVYKYM